MCQINNISLCRKPNNSGRFYHKTENGNATVFKIKEPGMVRFGVLYDREKYPRLVPQFRTSENRL